MRTARGGCPLPERSAGGRQAYQALLLLRGVVIHMPRALASIHARYFAIVAASLSPFYDRRQIEQRRPELETYGYRCACATQADSTANIRPLMVGPLQGLLSRRRVRVQLCACHSYARDKMWNRERPSR
jgi:hypothetical protein